MSNASLSPWPWDQRERCVEPVTYRYIIAVRGTPYASDDRPSSASASDSRLPSAPATSSLFRNAFGRMTSYATRSRSHDVV